jgi:hypothetical protein
MTQPTLSPSQVKVAQSCMALWGFNYTLPKTPSTDAQRKGLLLHGVQENYLKHGARQDTIDPTITDLAELKLARAVGSMALAGLPWLPGPGTGHVEGEALVTISGIRYKVFLDYAGPSDLLPSAPAGLRAVVDHKTSSNPTDYGLWGKAAFLGDAQALVYAAKEMIQHNTDSVFCRWIYYWTTRKSKALPSDVILTRAEVEGAFGGVVHETAQRLVQIRTSDAWRTNTLDPNTLAKNYDHCGAYGGCPHSPERGGPCDHSKKPQPESSDASTCFQGMDNQIYQIRRSENVMAAVPNLFNSLINTPAGGNPFAPANGTAAAPAPAKAVANPFAVGPAAAPAAAKPVTNPFALPGTPAAAPAPAAVPAPVVAAAPAPVAAPRPDMINAPEAAKSAPTSAAASSAKLTQMINSPSREQYAHTAMAQLVAACGITLDPDVIAARAVAIADALVRELKG